MGGHRWVLRATLGGVAFALVLIGWAVMARRLSPAANTSRDHFDTILVLGTPADADGNPTPEQLARVTEGVREYERGVAPRLLFTGGPARRGCVSMNVVSLRACCLRVVRRGGGA